MDQIKISLAELSEIASQIRLLNSNLDEVLNYVLKLMNDLNAVWMSDGAEAIIARFQKFSSRFIDESETIESYARFLDLTVSSYDSLESTIKANAEGFN